MIPNSFDYIGTLLNVKKTSRTPTFVSFEKENLR